MTTWFSAFDKVDLDDWKQLTKKELKGQDINELGLWLKSEGFQARPAYFRKETEELPLYGQTIRPLRFNQRNNDWLIGAEVRVEDVDSANAELLRKVSLGATAITVDLNGRDFARDELGVLFKNVALDAVSVAFRNAYNTLRFQADYLEWRAMVDPSEGGSRPLFGGIKGGFWFQRMNADLAAAIINENHQLAFGTLGLDAGLFYQKGANTWQQLGATLAWGNEILNGLRERGISFERVSGNLGFSFAIGSSFLPEVAKFRLIRFLWARIMQQHGAAHKRWKTWVHGRSGERHLGQLDRPVNLVRENAQAMSAVLGGADSLTLQGFDEAQKVLSERMAINTHHLMKEEAGLDQVIDPTAGSYYVEHLTDLLGTKAWDFFIQIEQAGGYAHCMANGFLDETFTEAESAFQEELENLDRVLVGINKYPSPFEKLTNEV